jgi:hypothetical protein
MLAVGDEFGQPNDQQEDRESAVVQRPDGQLPVQQQGQNDRVDQQSSTSSHAAHANRGHARGSGGFVTLCA